MKFKALAIAIFGTVLATASVTSRADEPPAATKEKNSAWSVAIRFGGFSDNGGDRWWVPHTKSYGYDPTPQVTGGIDVSRFFGRRNGLTLSIDGMTFAGDAVAMTPMTLTYKFFPIGNGLLTEPGRKPPVVQPWIGIGGGIYTFVLDDTDITRTDPGAQASAGLYVPLGRHFDVLGELRYAATSDARVLSYTMGFGVRF